MAVLKILTYIVVTIMFGPPNLPLFYIFFSSLIMLSVYFRLDGNWYGV